MAPPTACLPGALRALTIMIESPYGGRPGWWLPASHPPTAIERLQSRRETLGRLVAGRTAASR
jgi:hypothetical protein